MAEVVDEIVVSLRGVDLSEVNRRYADRLHTECRSGDNECDGGRADDILCDLLREIGCPQVAEVYEALDLWRA